MGTGLRVKGDQAASDEATGLPPLEMVEPELAIYVMAWEAVAGVVATPTAPEPVAVRYLNVRGLVRGRQGPASMEWAQVYLAVPVEHALEVAAALAKGTTEEL